MFDSQRRPVLPGVARLRSRCTSTWGLRGIELEIAPGESVGLVGRNGAGKSTLLRTLGGVYMPDEGRAVVRGRVGALLSPTAGVGPFLTGRENALLLGVLSGLSRTEAEAIIAPVHRRSGLGPAFDRLVSSYSQGMRARLGFAVIREARPEILLLDEVHEAVDHDFRAEIEELAEDILAAGGIVVAAGHDHAALRGICSRCIWLEGGCVHADGEFDEIERSYRAGPAALVAP
jgi:ABC-type polysaccharide/polyol phosphate transport system ATPase subunit